MTSRQTEEDWMLRSKVDPFENFEAWVNREILCVLLPKWPGLVFLQHSKQIVLKHPNRHISWLFVFVFLLLKCQRMFFFSEQSGKRSGVVGVCLEHWRSSFCFNTNEGLRERLSLPVLAWRSYKDQNCWGEVDSHKNQIFARLRILGDQR